MLRLPRLPDLSLLAVSSISSTTFSIVQQIRDITFYVDIVTEGFERKLRLPADDPELAIANGSFGVDLVLYYLRMTSRATPCETHPADTSLQSTTCTACRQCWSCSGRLSCAS